MRRFIFLFLLILNRAFSGEFYPEKILSEMTLDKKIGQLFIAAAYASSEQAALENTDFSIEEMDNLLCKHHIGGILLKRRWDPKHQIEIVKHYQSQSKIPLLICQDCEWGLSMRLDHVPQFPKNCALGTVQDLSLIYRLGKEIARQCRIVGVNFNLSPVVDVNSNPNNPVIGERSFGSNPHDVAKRGVAMMKGLQDGGVLACAKHFPGHGDTYQDSHECLPTILHDLSHLQNCEFIPFKEMIENGVQAVMTAHLYLPALEFELNLPVSLSSKMIKDCLQQQLQFKGLIITDDLAMGAIAKNFSPEEAALKAFLAGNDLLLTTFHITESIQAIKNAFFNGMFTMDELDSKVIKILRAKEWIIQQKPLENYELFTPESEILLKILS